MKVKDWYYLYFENLNQTVKYSANKLDLDREKRKNNAIIFSICETIIMITMIFLIICVLIKFLV